MPFDLGPGALVWLAVACLVAGFVRGYSGFGFSALLIAASSLVTNPLNFVAVVVILETVMSLQAAKGAGPDVDWRRVGWLLGGAALATKKLEIGTGVTCPIMRYHPTILAQATATIAAAAPARRSATRSSDCSRSSVREPPARCGPRAAPE